MKSNRPITPLKTAEKQDMDRNREVESEQEGFMHDSAVMKFIDDIKDGDMEKFDTTTTPGFWKELFIRIKKVDVTGLGSQLAFFFLLSLFPLLIFIMTLLPFLNLDQAQIFLFIREYAPESVAILIENTLGEVLENRNGSLLSIGILATIWSASKGMNALTKALNLSYFTEETRSFFVARSMSVVFTIMLIGVFIVALVLPVFGQQIGFLAFSALGLEDDFIILWNNLRWIIPPDLDFPSVFSDLLVSTEFKNPVKKCDSRSCICHGRLDTNVSRIFVLCRKLRELFKNIWEYRSDYRADDVALLFGDHPNSRRSAERCYDRKNAS